MPFIAPFPTYPPSPQQAMLRRILGGPRGPPALPPRPASRSAADQHPPDLARERSKTVTSFYNQPAIDAAAEKVGGPQGGWG